VSHIKEKEKKGLKSTLRGKYTNDDQPNNIRFVANNFSFASKLKADCQTNQATGRDHFFPFNIEYNTFNGIPLNFNGIPSILMELFLISLFY
jgi:hypothetical protein